jgi:hypothetical protein
MAVKSDHKSIDNRMNFNLTHLSDHFTRNTSYHTSHYLLMIWCKQSFRVIRLDFWNRGYDLAAEDMNSKNTFSDDARTSRTQLMNLISNSILCSLIALISLGFFMQVNHLHIRHRVQDRTISPLKTQLGYFLHGKQCRR